MSLRSSLLSIALLFSPALVLHGCADASCTQLTCHDTVTLTFTLPDGSQAQDLKGQVLVGAEEFEVDCTSDTSTCDGGAILLEVAPTESVSLNISEQVTFKWFVGAVALTLTTSAPNGEACGPICEHGSAEIVLQQMSTQQPPP